MDYRKSNAIDVEQFEEYKSMIQRLSKQKKRNVTLLIQFEAVKKYVTTPRQSDDAAADVRMPVRFQNCFEISNILL